MGRLEGEPDFGSRCAEVRANSLNWAADPVMKSHEEVMKIRGCRFQRAARAASLIQDYHSFCQSRSLPFAGRFFRGFALLVDAIA